MVTLICGVLVAWGLWECGLGYAQLLGMQASRHVLYPATGSFYNPGPYCGFLAMIMPVALGVVLSGNARRPLYWLSVLYMMAALALMPVLMGRTGWLAAAAGCLTAYMAAGRVANPRRLLLWTGAACMVALPLLYWLKPASALGRLFLWRMGLDACLTRPWSGVGWNNVAGALGEAQEAWFASHPDSAYASVAGSPEYAFNEFLQIGVAWGVPAALLFAAAIAAVAVVSVRGRCGGIAGAAVAFAVVCFSSYPLQFAQYIGAMALVCCAAVCTWRRLHVAAVWIVCGAVVATAALACAGVQHRDAMSQRWKTMRYAYQHRLSDKNLSALDSIASGMDWSARFMFDYGKALRHNGLYARSTEVLERGVDISSDPMFLNLIGRNCVDMGLYAEAEHYYRRSIDRLPGRLYPYYLLAQLYASPEYFNDSCFKAVYRVAIDLEPKIQSPAIRQMKAGLHRLNDSIASR